jgi:hypothetical protein
MADGLIELKEWPTALRATRSCSHTEVIEKEIGGSWPRCRSVPVT